MKMVNASPMLPRIANTFLYEMMGKKWRRGRDTFNSNGSVVDLMLPKRDVSPPQRLAKTA